MIDRVIFTWAKSRAPRALIAVSTVVLLAGCATVKGDAKKPDCACETKPVNTSASIEWIG